jgi:four helix bundle protein
VIKKRDADLHDQAYRAAKSMALNTAEGGRREQKDRAYHFRVAAGSAQELRMALEIAEAFSMLDRASIVGALRLIDRQLAMLWRLRTPR